jgi:urea transport system ATP-binding protein
MGILEISHLSKSFDTTQVLTDFSLDVTEHTLRCLIGPNGAGKTTTMDVITGRQHPTSGTIVFDGVDISAWGEHAISRRGIGRKFQVPAVFRDLTVRENLQVADRQEFNPFRNMFRGRERVSRAKVADIAASVGLSGRLDTHAGVLSHGEIQWLEIGMVLMQDPKLLLMDEPTAGMTEHETEKTATIFNALKKSHTLLVVEHDMGFVRSIADVVTVMHMGRLLAEGTIAEIEVNARVREVYLGTEDLADAA